MGSARTTTVRAAVGASESFDTVEAAAEAADRARAALEPSCDLALVFASGHHLGMAKWLLSEIHERLEPRALIGCGAGGTVAGGSELEDTPGVAVWAASMPGAELETMHVTAERDGQGFRLLGLPESLAGDGEAAAD
jgi:small ligand-binding sensory domain FIST